MKGGTYRSILKGSAVFGGVQVFNIFIGLIRGKLVALFLGPFGVGLSSLLISTTNVLIQFSSFGVNLSAVKDIAKAVEDGDQSKAGQITFNFRILSILLAALGGFLCFVFAPLLSQYTFDNTQRTGLFQLLSLFVIFTILGSGELAIMQANRNLSKVAISSVMGASVGVILAIPFYYYLRTDGIVPAIISLSACTYLAYLLLNLRGKRNSIDTRFKFERNVFVTNSKHMMSLGIVLMVSSLFGTIILYFINIFINRFGGVSDVGYFQSASSITTQYTGLIFSAMAVDYFPKLAAKADSPEDVRKIVNEQLEIVCLLIAPIVTLFIVFSPLVVRILLTEDFLVIVPLINFMAFGAFFKGIAYPLGYISFAKGDKKFFFWMEGFFSNILQLSLNILCYYYYGLKGLGISYIGVFIIYFIIINLVTKKRYHYRPTATVKKLIFVSLVPLLVVFIASMLTEAGWIRYVMYSISSAFIICYALKQLDQRIGFFNFATSKITKS